MSASASYFLSAVATKATAVQPARTTSARMNSQRRRSARRYSPAWLSCSSLKVVAQSVGCRIESRPEAGLPQIIPTAIPPHSTKVGGDPVERGSQCAYRGNGARTPFGIGGPAVKVDNQVVTHRLEDEHPSVRPSDTRDVRETCPSHSDAVDSRPPRRRSGRLLAPMAIVLTASTIVGIASFEIYLRTGGDSPEPANRSRRSRARPRR